MRELRLHVRERLTELLHEVICTFNQGRIVDRGQKAQQLSRCA